MSEARSILLDRAQYEQLLENGDDEALFAFLAGPLHESLYLHGSFEWYDKMTFPQQMVLAFDYLRMQAGQGGFIQFLSNGYVSLLPDLIGGFTRVGEIEMAGLLDDVLKVYVLNKDFFDKAETVEAFARLYDELKEFEALDAAFTAIQKDALRTLTRYVVAQITELGTLV